jgi:acetyl-CoA decarbonylase/synthase complex subunit gamma
MALTGIQIFKLLPKTNCKECGVPTCLAFAMNLASGKAELDSCPYVSDEAREKLSEASAPPIRPVVVGNGVRKATAGGETVQYRHEKTFYNPPCWQPRSAAIWLRPTWKPSSKAGMPCSSSGWG